MADGVYGGMAGKVLGTQCKTLNVPAPTAGGESISLFRVASGRFDAPVFPKRSNG